jgi:hypothetical protein
MPSSIRVALVKIFGKTVAKVSTSSEATKKSSPIKAAASRIAFKSSFAFSNYSSI